ncbi:MAG: glycosyltransferase family 4 protein [Burkholderiaceae bacterium]|nr:glycosyltransferase family 4 protein [Burkholderiaceae bacterium]
MTPDTLYINGKFTAQRVTGVQRVAVNQVLAIDRCLGRSETAWPVEVVLLVPPGAPPLALQRIAVSEVGDRRLPLHLWEQILLPFAARRGVLLNLAGAAPLLAARQACLLHDAVVFDRPHAYTAAFRLWYRAMFRLLPRRRASLLTVSSFSRERLALHLNVPPSSFAVVPNGGGHLRSVEGDASVLVRLGLTNGGYFLAVGSRNPNKNFRTLQQAFVDLPSRDVRLVLVGGDEERVFAKDTAADRSDERIVRAGPLADAELKALYQHAVGLVFPSRYEGFGLPPVEAMDCGCPVLASNAAAIPEVCGEAALYFDPASASQMTAAMQRVLDEPALRERLVRAGTERVRCFDWDRSALALLSHLDSARRATGGAS